MDCLFTFFGRLELNSRFSCFILQCKTLKMRRNKVGAIAVLYVSQLVDLANKILRQAD